MKNISNYCIINIFFKWFPFIKIISNIISSLKEQIVHEIELHESNINDLIVGVGEVRL